MTAGPSLPDGGAALPFLRLANAILRFEDHFLVPFGLTANQWHLLQILRHEGSLSSIRASAALGVVAPTVTRLADQLAERGLLERRATGRDRRVRLLQLTEAGLVLAEQTATLDGSFARCLTQHVDPIALEPLPAICDRLAADLLRTP